MSIENLPSGRERAVETLIDMEPRGPFYRASRVLVSTGTKPGDGILRKSVIVAHHGGRRRVVSFFFP